MRSPPLHALLLAALLLAGCLETPPKPAAAQKLYALDSPLVSTPGKRLLVKQPDGKVVAKWRLRRQSTKIYGPSRQPLGTLREHQEAGGATEIVVTPLAAQAEPIRARVEPDGRGHINDLIYLEPHQGRLLIKDRQEALLGVVNDVSGDGELGVALELRASYALQAPVKARAERDASGRQVTLSRGGKLAMSAAGGVPAAALIAMELSHESLDPLHRAALAAALHHAIIALKGASKP